jgi:two-component system nitrate/nitrite sensor histidine kinase NarX
MPSSETIFASAGGRGSLLVLVSGLLSFILVLSLSAMASGLLIATLTQGMGAAINQSGTLRMQSYRIALAMNGGPAVRSGGSAEIERLAMGLQARLSDPRLTDAIPSAASDPVRLAYTRIQRRWVDELLPAIRSGATAEYLSRVDGFVDDVHDLVSLLERRTERRIHLLWVVETVAVALTLVAALFTLLLLRRRVLRPLQVLLRVAEKAGSGDFAVRTPFVGTDELGRLGIAMNRMSQDLSGLYGQLETRVASKTRDLERSNRSLQLLYRSAQALDGARLSEARLLAVLADLHAELGLRTVRLCLAHAGGDLAPSSRPVGAQDRHASNDAVKLLLGAGGDPEGCPAPGEGSDGGAAGASIRDAGVVAFEIADQQARYGTLWVLPGSAAGLEAWQQPVLQSWAKQLATALNLRDRLREGRRLAVHEERSILARELHDSLAQSLSYMKIQAMRLEQALAAERPQGTLTHTDTEPDPSPAVIVADLRAGINSAYRHLRELLTSFRLKIDGDGLRAALHATVAEYEAQGGLAVEHDDRLVPGLLSPSQEIHVLQIVREALSNVRRHARASRAAVALSEHDGIVDVEVVDDGIGIGGVEAPWAHHGLSIMRERATSLVGELVVGPAGDRGTRVHLRFPVQPTGAELTIRDGRRA